MNSPTAGLNEAGLGFSLKFFFANSQVGFDLPANTRIASLKSAFGADTDGPRFGLLYGWMPPEVFRMRSRVPSLR